MDDPIKSFGGVASGLARGPLGIIALFIVLVYGFASTVAAFGGSFSPAERLPLIYFMVLFPVVVLAVFSWLVSRHSTKLYPPTDFKDENTFLEIQRMQLSAVASLTAASVAKGDPASGVNVERTVEVVQRVSKRIRTSSTKEILWVDDRPENNIYTQRAFEAVGAAVTLAESTDVALRLLKNKKFDVIISDMGRREGPREGYVLLDRIRKNGLDTPFFIHAASGSAEHKRETEAHGGQGCTNNPSELFKMVTDIIDR